VEQIWEDPDAEAAGVLTIVYDHHQRDLTQQMLDIQHNAVVQVVATTHVHLDHHNCLEAIILRGRPADIEEMRLMIGGLRGVRYSALTRAARLEL
jgi:CopG family nickel-responsive transcriptional regulator